MTTGRDREEELSKTLAVQHILDPKRENLRDVSNIPTGMVKSLTSLGAYTTQVETLIKQIRARQYWYIKRQVEKEYTKKEWAWSSIEDAKTRGKDSVDGNPIKDEDRVKLKVINVNNIPYTINGKIDDKDIEYIEYDWKITETKSEAERKVLIDIRFTELELRDKLDVDQLFISQLMDSYCHTSRGKNGLVLDKGTIMAEAEIQTRNPDNNNEPNVPRRS